MTTGYAPIYGARRRRRDWRPAVGLLALAAGVAALLAVAPAARLPGAAAPPSTPDALIHTEAHSVRVLGVLRLKNGTLAALVYLRGPRAGRAAVFVDGCPAGGAVRNLSTGDRTTWVRGELGIDDLTAAAACAAPGAGGAS